MNRPEVLTLVVSVVAQVLDVEPSSIGESFVLAPGRGEVDSIAFIQILENLEAKLLETEHVVRVEDEQIEDIITVRDAVDLITAQITSQPV